MVTITLTWNVDNKLYVWWSNFMCCHRRKKGREGGVVVGRERMIQVPRNWLHWTMASRSRATVARWGRYHTEAQSQRPSSDKKSIYKISLTLCEVKGGGVSGIWASVCVCVCVCVCWGRGGRRLKWERKGDSDRLKKKWRKGGGDWPGAVSPKKKKKKLSKPHHSILKDLLYHKSPRINFAQ